MKLKDLLAGVPGTTISGDPAAEILDLTHDSRQARPQAAFFAVPGSRTDGNRHARDAVRRGAAAVVSELAAPPAPMALLSAPEKAAAWVQVPDVLAAMARASTTFFGDPSAALTVVGVTGTNGKTTVTYFLESIFARAGGIPGVVGTTGHRLRGRLLERAVNTTPFSLELTRLLAAMRDQGATHAAMEVSSHALATRRVEGIRFDVGVMTNLHSDHLDFHQTRERYLEAKARLFELLERPDPAKRRRAAVVYRDDEAYPAIKRRIQDAPLVSFGLSEESDYRAAGIASTVSGSVFRIRRSGKEWAARMRLPGEHNVLNALAAAAAAWELGTPPEAILEGLAALKRVPGRLEPVEAGQDFAVFVDYAHTEGALRAVLSSLKALPHRRIVTVFGCGGERDRTKRAPMGRAACELSDHVLAASDNPRGEDPMAILREIEEGMRRAGRQNYKIIPDRREAIYEAVRLAQAGDIVLVAGKGHEDTQVLREGSARFDDREVAQAALKDLAKA